MILQVWGFLFQRVLSRLEVEHPLWVWMLGPLKAWRLHLPSSLVEGQLTGRPLLLLLPPLLLSMKSVVPWSVAVRRANC